MYISRVKILINQWALLCFITTAVGQNNELSDQVKHELIREKQDYMETFEKEQQNLSRKPASEKRVLDTRPAHIPLGMLSFSNGMAGTKKVVGISDPCLDSNKAFEMAKYRALAVAGLSNKLSVQYISDYYSNEESKHARSSHRNTWEEFGKIEASINWQPGKLRVIDSHFTNYKEGMVKLRIRNGQGHNHERKASMKIKIDVYHIRKKVGKHHNDQWKYDLSLNVKKGTSTSFSSNYTLIQSANALEATSTWQGKKDSLCKAYFLYRSKSTPKDTANFKMDYSLDHGLWAAYFKGIVHNIIETSQQEARKIKNLQENQQKNYEDLSRLIARDRFRLKFNHLAISNNQLKPHIKVYKQNTGN